MVRCNGQGHMWSGFGPEAVPVFLFRGEEGGCRHLLSPQVDRFIEAFLAGAVHGDFPLFVIAFVVVPEYIEGCVEGVVRWVEVPLLLDPGGPLLIRFFKGLSPSGVVMFRIQYTSTGGHRGGGSCTIII